MLWSKADIDYLKEHYPTTETSEIATKMNRTTRAIYSQANLLEIKKTQEHLKANVWVFPTNEGARYRFQKGHKPANKGLKMSAATKEKSKHTFFETGHIPHNTKSDGVIVIRHDQRGVACKFIRIAKAKWIAYQRHIWQNEHGEIPKGSIIIFKDGNTMNCELSNLEMLTKAENMLRNSIHKMPPELKEISDISKQITIKIRQHG